MGSFYTAAKMHCKGLEVAVLVGGDDELLGRKVFKVLNAVYHRKKPAVAYSNHFFGGLQKGNFSLGYSAMYSKQ